MRKTKKYYRDKINESFDTACSVIAEVIEKYGSKISKDVYCISSRTEYTHNYRIEGFGYNKKSNTIWVNIYWQGDSTDGETDITLADVRRGVVIPAESFFDGERTRETHGDITVSLQDTYNAMLYIAENKLVRSKNDV